MLFTDMSISFANDYEFYLDLTILSAGIGGILLGIFGKPYWLWRSRLVTIITGVLIAIIAIMYIIQRLVMYHTW